MTTDFQPLIIIDSREPKEGAWEPFFSLPAVRGKLDSGDYSLAGCEEWICIERKTLDDLVSCLCTGRDRFTRELQRTARIRDFYVVCEGSYVDIAKGHYHSAMKPRAAWESVIALQSRYAIPFLFAGSTELAAKLAESILLRWYKEHVKAVESATKGICLATDNTRQAPSGHMER